MDNTFYLIGIDPGNNLGISIFHIDNNFNILDITTYTHCLDHFYFSISPNKIINKLYYLKSIITNLLDYYHPLSVSIESAFMNNKFPKAIMNLSQYVGTIELSVREYSSFIKVFKYAPKYVKSVICKGDANKEDMLTNIKKIEEINKHLDYSNITEHSIDATAIAYTSLIEIREDPFILAAII